MNVRWLRIAALVVIVGFIAWVASHLRFTETHVPLPLKGEAVTNPYYAAIKLTERLHAKATWERIFSVPATDSVVLLSSWNWSLSRARRERLETWVANGGRLVVDNSLIGGAEEFEKWAGVSRLEHDQDEDEDEDKEDADQSAAPDEVEAADSEAADAESTTTEPADVEPDAVDEKDDQKRRRRHGTRERRLVEQFMDEDCISLTEDGTQRTLSVCGIDTSVSLASSRKLLWALRSDRRIEALRVAVGRGSVTVLNVSPFRYRDFFQGDHPSLFVAATQLHHGDDVFFFTEEDHASLLALTWRYAAPAVLLLVALIGLALWRNTSRFGPLAAVPEKARRSLAEQIRGTGQFTLRFGGGRALHAAAARALREAAIRRLPAYDRLSTEERVAALAKLTGVPAGELAPALEYSGARSPHELRNVIAVLETARRRLTMKKAKVRG
jgi:hypothetical protein